MALALTSDEREALREGPIELYVCIDLFLDGGTQSFWDGPEDVSLGGRDYVAIGAFAGATSISMGADLGGAGVELTLDASRLLAAAGDVTDPAYFLSTIIADGGYRQRRMEMAYSFWNSQTRAHIMNKRRFTGLIDQMEIREEPGDDGAGRALLIVRCESLTLRYSERIGRLRSHEDQNEIWSGDDFFKLCAGSIAQERNLIWGHASAKTQAGNSQPSGGTAAARGSRGGPTLISKL